MRTRCLAVVTGMIIGVFLAGCRAGDPTTPQPPSTPLTFKGTISSGGASLSGVKVFLSWDTSKETLTDTNGEFTFTGLSGSHFIVTPSLLNHAFSPSNYELGSQARSDLDFSVQPASYGSVLGAIVADFTAKNQNNADVSLYDRFGKAILINFSADWCGPCQNEAGHLEALYQAYKGQGFEILTLLLSGSPADWASAYGLTFPVLDDSAWSLWAIYGEGYIPLNIVLDRNMTIRYKQAGYNESTITATIKKYL